MRRDILEQKYIRKGEEMLKHLKGALIFFGIMFFIIFIIVCPWVIGIIEILKQIIK